MTQYKIHYHKYPEGGPTAVILHRSEWNRLEKQAGPPEEPSQQKNEELKALIERSQEWMKTWPDTVQGCVAQKAKQRKKKHAEQVATVEAFSKRKVHKSNEETIRKAKQKIFDTSCYGKKLISALLESKVLEERDAQIQFSKEIKEKEAELEGKKQNIVTFCTFELDKHETTMEDKYKYQMIQNAKENIEMYKKKKEEEMKAKEQEQLAELTDAQLMKYLLEREREAEDKIKLLEKQAVAQYEAAQKKTKEEKVKREAEYSAKIETCRKQQEKIKCKIELQLYKESQNSAVAKTFDTVKKCQEKEQKRLEEFIEKSVKEEEARAVQRELSDKEKRIQERNKKIAIAEINKSMAAYVNLRESSNKCFCDRQSFFTKSKKKRLKKRLSEIEPESQVKPLPYFGPCNKLLAALKRREKEPPSWTGVNETNQLFMKNADKTLEECKYKLPARKVINEYRKSNGLDKPTIMSTKEQI